MASGSENTLRRETDRGKWRNALSQRLDDDRDTTKARTYVRCLRYVHVAVVAAAAAALHIVTSVNCRHPVAVVSWSRRGSRCWMTVAGVPAAIISLPRRLDGARGQRATDRHRESGTSSLERHGEPEREREGEMEENRENHSAYARRVLPAHVLLPPGMWYRNHEASRSGEEKEHCPSRCAASLSRPVEDRGLRDNERLRDSIVMTITGGTGRQARVIRGRRPRYRCA